MQLYGIALLPEKQFSDDLIQFQHDHLDFFKQPELLNDGFLPHMSILQCPFDPIVLQQNFEQIVNSWELENANASITGDLIDHTHGWKFLNIVIQPWMEYLQANLIELTSSMIDRSQIKEPDNFNDFSFDEQKSFLRYGYPYTGLAFHPHFTLGFNSQTTSIPDDIYMDAFQRFNQRTLIFSKLVIYQAGLYGAMDWIMSSYKLN